MAAPVWTTTAGKIASINERESYSLALEANDTDSTSLTYSLIAGSLPPGLELTSDGVIQGVPFEVATRRVFKFVVRVSDGTNIADRTFTIEIKGADEPTFTTASGILDFSDSTRSDYQRIWVIDGSKIQFQIEAVDTDTATGQELLFDIVEGTLPPGTSMSKSGLITGTVGLTDDELYGPMGGYSGKGYDQQGYDPLVYSKSRSILYEFIVRVSDGSSSKTQTNSIQVITADFWRIDNNQITIDGTTYKNSPLTIDLSAIRKPVFTTDSDLGTYRHDNKLVLQIDVEDFDPLQAALEYSVISGSLPPGISIDTNTGELYGTLPTSTAVTTLYTFTIRANRTVATGLSVYNDKEFTLRIIGDIDVGVSFTSTNLIGTLTAGVPSLLSVKAVGVDTNRVLNYSVTSGSLPTGITLSPQGNFVGTIDYNDFTIFENNAVTFDSNTTTIDKEFNFEVTVTDQYKTVSTTKEFKIIVSLPFNKTYGNLGTSGIISKTDQNIFDAIRKDSNINNPEYVYRPEDPNFGVTSSAGMLLLAGLEHKTLTEFQNKMALNHEPKRLYFNGLKTATAKLNGVIEYEVVYIEMIDPLVNSAGKSVSKSITLRDELQNIIQGPVSSDDMLTADATEYNVTTGGGMSFRISGSKVRYANELSADLDYVKTVYPNAVENMRTQMKSLGNKEWIHLPLWMRTTQTGDLAPLGFKPAIVLAYCKPGKAGLVKQRITDKKLQFENIEYIIDRYQISNPMLKVDPSRFEGDGSTTSFSLNELINEEEIKLTRDGVEIFVQKVFKNLTADVNTVVSDDTRRSGDFENEFFLTHDTENKQSTINFTSAPIAGAKFVVSRQSGDKYLVFERKGI